jgi:photosystem II stability/assembly factor-like uncharacterized protein
MTMLGWEMGDVSGRISALAIHPASEDVIYLGAASGGLWKTIDGGSSWMPIFDAVGTQTIGALLIDPSSPDTVWVGTGEQGQNCWSYFGMGLFRSLDGGATLTPITDYWGPWQKVHQDTHVLRFSRVDPNRFWVAGDGGSRSRRI